MARPDKNRREGEEEARDRAEACRLAVLLARLLQSVPLDWGAIAMRGRRIVNLAERRGR